MLWMVIVGVQGDTQERGLKLVTKSNWFSQKHSYGTVLYTMLFTRKLVLMFRSDEFVSRLKTIK